MAGFTVIVDAENTFAPGAGGWSPWRSGTPDRSVDVSDWTYSIGLHQLARGNVENTAYEMTVGHLTLLIREVDGEHWASWGHEHAAGDSVQAASLELWNQLGQYLESLEADDDSLAPDLHEDLEKLRSIMRRR